MNQGWLPELGIVEVAAPCREAWEPMTGDAQVRRCAACKLNVYSLSDMTAEEARQLLKSTEQRLCVRFWVRPDGRLLTSDCPVGLAARARRKVAAVFAAVAAVLAAWGLLGEEPQSGPGAPAPIARVDVPQPPAAAGPVVGPEWADERRKGLPLSRGRWVQGKRMTVMGIIPGPSK